MPKRADPERAEKHRAILRNGARFVRVAREPDGTWAVYRRGPSGNPPLLTGLATSADAWRVLYGYGAGWTFVGVRFRNGRTVRFNLAVAS
jgi:hypothetical protein